MRYMALVLALLLCLAFSGSAAAVTATPTPKASEEPELTLREAFYLGVVSTQAATLSESINRISSPANQNISLLEWRDIFLVEVSMWNNVFEFLSLMEPPARFIDLHAHLLGVASDMAGAGQTCQLSTLKNDRLMVRTCGDALIQARADLDSIGMELATASKSIPFTAQGSI
jgi:hypothetical protein